MRSHIPRSRKVMNISYKIWILGHDLHGKSTLLVTLLLLPPYFLISFPLALLLTSLHIGYEALGINRIHYSLKDNYKRSKNLEFIWRPSATLGREAEMLTHVLHTHYAAPIVRDKLRNSQLFCRDLIGKSLRYHWTVMRSSRLNAINLLISSEYE